MTTLMLILIFSSSGIIGLISLYPLLKPYCGHEVDLPVKVKSKHKKQRFYIQHVIYKNTK